MSKTFFLAAFSLISVYTASSSVIPLLGEIQKQLTLGIDGLAIISIAYFMGCCTSLLLFSRISNALGRKTVTIIALTLAFASCFLLTFFTSPVQVYIARFIQGLGCGLGTSAIMSYTIDAVSEPKRNIAATFNVCGPGIGFLVGCSSAFLLVKFTTINPLYLFLGVATYIGLMIILIATMAQETISVNYSIFKSTLIPKLEVPKEFKSAVIIASLIFVTTWLIGGFYQAFLPLVATENFKVDATISGVFFLAFMIPQTFGGFLVKKYPPLPTFIWTLVLFTFDVFVIFISIYFSYLYLFLISSFFGGLLASATTASVMSFTVVKTKIEQRSGIISTVYLMGFLGAGLPNYFLGKVAQSLDFNSILLMYPAIGVAGLVLTLIGVYFLILVKNKANH